MKRHTLDDIYRSYMHDVYRYLLSLCHDKYVAEDIVQETFYRAYLHLDECPAEKIKPWLFRVARNTFIDAKRKSQRSQAHDINFFETFGAKSANQQSTEEKILVQEELDEVWSRITQLPDRQKHAIVLCDFCDLTYVESAEIMEITVNYFKVLLFRARHKIRETRERGEVNE